MALTLNDAEAFAYAGARAGAAQNVDDAACVASWRDWARRAWNLEKPEDRAVAQEAYHAAYAHARRTGIKPRQLRTAA